MRAFVLRRIAQMLVTLWVILTIIFVMFRILPGDPASLLIELNLPPDARADMLHQWGLDQPLHVQYVRYFANILRGEFGNSFSYHRSAFEVMRPFIVNSVMLMLPAILLATLLAIVGGAYLGWHRGGRLEKAGVVISLFLHSVPIYWIAIVLLVIFGYWLGWFPTGNIRTPGYLADTFAQKFFSLDYLRHAFLPLLTAVLFLSTDPLLLMRSSMLEVQGEEFLEMLRAKGLSERQLITHAARNAILPVVTYLALLSTLAVGGSVLLETVFAWPGMGREIVRAVASLDYPMAQAAFFMWSAAIVLMNFVADLLYGWLDPRIVYR